MFGLILFLSPFFLHAQSNPEGRTTTSFDNDWRFLKSDVTGAEKSSFDDSKWRKLNVPHDWSIEGPYDQNNPTGRGGGYLPAGIGWYRKTFTLNEADAKRKVSIEFDGVMTNSDVWINGFHLGKRPYGYSSFSYDLSGHLNFGKGKTNVLAVRADNSVQPASRYYTGAGIYRHVRLVSTNDVHLDHWGTYITSTQVSAAKANIKVQVKISNEAAAANEITLQTLLIDPSGKTVKSTETKQTVAAGKTVEANHEIEVNNPQLWNLEQPNLYRAVTKIISNGKTVDTQTTTFGIRDSKFEAATGYWLNGKNIKIKGVCLHHDGGAVGAAVPLAVWERRFKLLKEAGVNAIRTSHNPVAPEFLDLCDQMGFLVMDETFDTWTAAKNNGEKGYNLYFTDWWKKDTEDMILRDRNHPSIVIYSVGNEIHDNLDSPEGFKKYKDQQNLVHQLDPTRPVTMALFRPNVSKVYANGFAATMDVVGQNYRENELIAAHDAHPDWKVIGTENTHVLVQWLALRDKPYMAGQFLWTGIDYLGEEDWPNVTNNQGLFDRTGGWKQQALQRQSWWSDKPVVHIVRKSDNAGAGNWVADWTPTDFDTYDNAKIQVYSNCDDVELFLNGKSLGTKSKPANDSPREWDDVTFEKGMLKAVGKNKGATVASEEFKSAGAPAKIVLSVDKNKLANTWDDVVYVTATIVDAQGIPCPNSDKLIKFSINGGGEIAAVDNGNIASHELYQTTERSAYRGTCIAIIKAKSSNGKVVVKAASAGLAEGSVTVDLTSSQTK
ncbi:MAG: glycoside hydrolase family 2 TIM barrel-domain containing protein [Janthinobacterium lividum]